MLPEPGTVKRLIACANALAEHAKTKTITNRSEGPVQVFNKYDSLDGLSDMDVKRVQPSTSIKWKKDHKPQIITDMNQFHLWYLI